MAKSFQPLIHSCIDPQILFRIRRFCLVVCNLMKTEKGWRRFMRLGREFVAESLRLEFFLVIFLVNET
ncbi:unnamed protein product [Lathyrus sativus]|nr:unnamed protein product [Lathyrus sativus]